MRVLIDEKNYTVLKSGNSFGDQILHIIVYESNVNPKRITEDIRNEEGSWWSVTEIKKYVKQLIEERGE